MWRSSGRIGFTKTISFLESDRLPLARTLATNSISDHCLHVPEDYSFWDLHVAIQDGTGWQDCHLHEFELVNVKNRSGEPNRYS